MGGWCVPGLRRMRAACHAARKGPMWRACCVRLRAQARVVRHRAQAPSSSRSPSRRITRTRLRPCASSPRCSTPTVRAPPLHLLCPSLTVWRAARALARSLCRRRHLPGHLAKQLEPHLRRVGGAHLHPVAALRPQPKLACQLRGGAHVHRVQARAPRRRANAPSLTLPPQTGVQQACAGTQCRFGALLRAPSADAFSQRRRLWSSLGRCHDHLPGREGPLYPRSFVDLPLCLPPPRPSRPSRRIVRRSTRATPPSLSAAGRAVDKRSRARTTQPHRRRARPGGQLPRCVQSCCRVPLLPANRRRCLIAHAEGRSLCQPWCACGE